MRVSSLAIHRLPLTGLAQLATAAVMLIAHGTALPARAEAADAVRYSPAATPTNAVTDWNLIAVNTFVQFPGPAGGAPPALQVHMAMVQGAVYDALNAIGPRRRRPYLLESRFASTASKEAAAATAAYQVLSNVVSTVPESKSFPNRADLLQVLDTEYETALAAIPDGLSKDQGIEAGNAAAAAMIAAREDDGRFGPTPWKSNAEQGHWQPQQNPDGTQALDPTPWVGGVRPFLIESPSQFRTEGPRALTSEAWAADFNEVKALGSVDSTTRTPEQTHIALWWQSNGGPTLMWNGVARDLASNPSYSLDMLDSALLLAQLNLSGADAAISCWNEKYYWDFWRPWNAIVEADRDGNPATQPDPSWTPLLYAPYPSHPSGHLSLDGAHLRVLQTFFGTDEVEFDVTSSRFDGETRHFERFSQPLDEIIEARIWAGLHYRNADVQAQILGGTIADYMVENFFQPEQ